MIGTIAKNIAQEQFFVISKVVDLVASVFW